MSDPVVLRCWADHEIRHHQWCEGCGFDSAVTVVVAITTETGVSTATKTACPRCGAGLTPKE